MQWGGSFSDLSIMHCALGIFIAESVGRSFDVSGKNDSEIYDVVKEKVVNGSCHRIVNDKLVTTDGTGLIK